MAITAETFDHEHNAEECIPCARCKHLTCEHERNEGDCQANGCTCPQWLADGDCPGESEDGYYFCNGEGGWWITNPYTEQDVWVGCGTCGGRGVWYDHSRKPAAS